MKPYIKGTTFPTVVDENNTLVNQFQFKAIPNGIFIDEEGTIRLLKEGFKVDNPEYVKAVERLINGEVDKIELDDDAARNEPSDLQFQLAQTKFKLGMEYVKQNRNEATLKIIIQRATS
ncbi:TlpA family protein disulfide reductase [Planococcus lenghuensis]|uniref:TlpA family protein disulfide reductase n=1 Tax=Planococcus lenghuensis TaxID=2213202 RepID=UPI001E3EDDAC|nr:hypothetical protein [Planococcus lenghuensis]